MIGLVLCAPSTQAEPHPIARVEDPVGTSGTGDGVYGRFAGDFAFEGGLGVEVAPTSSVRPLLYGDLSIYQTAGLYGSFRQTVANGDPTLRLASLGVDLSPLFLLRWSKAREWGKAYPDLILDSLTFSAGFRADEPRDGKILDSTGFEGALGLGVPLFGRAQGLWLRGRANLLTTSRGSVGTFWIVLTYQGFAHQGLLSVDP